MKIMHLIRGIFQPRIVNTARQLATDNRWEMVFFYAERGHPNGSTIIRWLAVRDNTIWLAETVNPSATPVFQQELHDSHAVEQKCRDLILWDNKYTSQGRDGLQVTLGLVDHEAVRYRELWNPGADCEAIRIACEIFKEAQAAET